MILENFFCRHESGFFVSDNFYDLQLKIIDNN